MFYMNIFKIVCTYISHVFLVVIGISVTNLVMKRELKTEKKD